MGLGITQGASCRRGQHWSDRHIGRRRYRRTLRNWSNYCEPGRPWRSSAAALVAAPGIPDNWGGEFGFRYQAVQGPLQSFVGGTIDPDRPVKARCRVTDTPSIWVDIEAVDTLSGAASRPGGCALLWPEAWRNTSLGYTALPHKLAKTLKLERPDHPATFRFVIEMAEGLTIKFEGNGAVILDADGVQRMRLTAPWGFDSSKTYPGTLDGRKPIRVALREGAHQGHRTVELTPDPDDLADAVYPVEIDPTVQITGTTDIEDANMRAHAVNNNYGGATSMLIGYYARGHGLIRVFPGSIPAGDITAFRLYVYSTRTPTIEVEAFFITDPNDWVEGTSSGAPATGACCWSQAKYTVQDWAGSPGCETSGVDFDADPTPPTKSMPGVGWHEWALDPAWPPLWRDAVRAPNGIKIRPITVGSDFTYFNSTESASYPLYFEIDYEEVGGAPVAAMIPRRIQ